MTLVTTASVRAAEPRTVYIDPAYGDDANDGASSAQPRRSMPGVDPLRDLRILVRRGTTLGLERSLRLADASVGAYGDGATRPRLRSMGMIGIEAVAGEVRIAGIALEGNSPRRPGTVGIFAVTANRAVIVDSELRGFYNGIVFAGEGGRIEDNVIESIGNNGILGGRNGIPAPSRYLIRGNRIDATGALNDAISLHDGDRRGEDNHIIGNDLRGAAENCVDVLSQYHGTLIEKNRMADCGEYLIRVGSPDVPDGSAHTRIVGNDLSSARYAAIRMQGHAARIENNHIHGIESQHGANALLLSGSAAFVGNRMVVPEGNRRPVIQVHDEGRLPAPRLDLRRNQIDNGSSQPVLLLRTTRSTPFEILAGSYFADNTYRASVPSGQAMLGITPAGRHPLSMLGGPGSTDAGARFVPIP